MYEKVAIAMTEPLISLCLPTNGIIEWVFPVLDSIYSQNVDCDKFEVIVTNNGDNEHFHQMMEEYARRHSNLVYRKTEAYLFDNQLEALRLAKGVYFKFLNHRAVLVEESIRYLVDAVEKNMDEKPVMYFSNGALKRDYICSSFDEFVANLARFASWTTGVGIWKEDYERIPSNQVYDRISPHSAILFSERKKFRYLIFNRVFSEEIEHDHSKKGKYDLFKAFGVEEPFITQKLYIDGDITAATFKTVKKDYRNMVAGLYWDFCIRKKPCSYDLGGFNDAMGIYFNKYDILMRAFCIGLVRQMKKIIRR